jgi:nucleoside-diphosphate-sugar epimerase
MSSPVLLLTGATGLVGSSVLQHWLKIRPAMPVFALTRTSHGDDWQRRFPQVEWTYCDLTREDLGLPREVSRRLLREVTAIVHCAADTRFHVSLQQARQINRDGTENLLRWAAKSQNLKQLGHLSTTYVLGTRAGWLKEEQIARPSAFLNSYQQSKWEAEALVYRYAKEVPAAVFRLSTLVGDSVTGQVRQFNYFHQLIRLMLRNILPVAPILPEALADLIPADWLSAALVHLLEHRFKPGTTYHLCAGPDNTITVGRLIEMTERFYQKHVLARRYLPLQMPRFVSLQEYQSYVANHRNSGNELLTEIFRLLGTFLPQLGIPQAFDNQRTWIELEQCGVRLPAFETYYPKIIDFCLRSQWGHAKSPKSERPLPCVA